MKRNKKIVMILSFCIGALMFVTAAFADMASKTGYDQLKDSLKFTLEELSENVKNFTFEGNITVKDNGKLLVSANTVQKIDNVSTMKKEILSSEFSNGKKENFYSYRDSNTAIWYKPDTDTYYVDEYSTPVKYDSIDNPFEEDRVKDLETIFDAIVGDLKSHVMVNDNANGGKEFSGTLDEGQIPPLINAITSFLFKNAFSERSIADDDISMPVLKEDIFLRHISGKASINGNGIIESIYGTATLSGKDKDGNTHELVFEVLVKIYDINSTTVAKPDLTGKKVEKHEIKSTENSITQKFIGKYKSDIIIEKNDSFIKIGERIVEITQIDNNRVVGQYSEIYKNGYEDYGSGNNFTFESEILDGSYAAFEYTDASGAKSRGTIHFNLFTGNVYLQMNFAAKDAVFDSYFVRVFDE